MKNSYFGIEVQNISVFLIYIFGIFYLPVNTGLAQEEIEIFPSNLLVKPFTANTLKPKLGFEFKSSVNEITLNISHSTDIIHFNYDEKTKFSLGADLFTYTLLRSQSNFHFPVDAVDYLFGVNFGFKKKLGDQDLGARLRISHISAHFVDGHFSKEENAWRDGREPIVYSREFLELMPFYRYNNFRFYAGITYIFSVDPPDIGNDQYQIGIEYFAENLISKRLTPYFAYDFRLINIFQYTGNNSVELGVKYGYSDGKGISTYFRYYSGYSAHGEYYDLKEDFTSVGFNLDI
jgi:hypothetical protein